MTKTTTNLIGILITILSGTYFFVMYCSECGAAEKQAASIKEIIPTRPETNPNSFVFSRRNTMNSMGNQNNDYNSGVQKPILPSHVLVVIALPDQKSTLLLEAQPFSFLDAIPQTEDPSTKEWATH